MRQLDILLPLSIVPSAATNGIRQHIDAPALSYLLGHGKKVTEQSFSPFCHALVHEYWLTQQLGLFSGTPDDNTSAPSIATALMQQWQLPLDKQYWCIVEPCHIDVGMNQLILTPRTQLHLSEEESRALFEVAKQCAKESDITLCYGNAQTWFLGTDNPAWQNLITSTPAVAEGMGIDAWIAQGDMARAWRKLHNTIQTYWYDHTVNQRREQSHVTTINALWLWGGASSKQTDITHSYQEVYTTTSSPYQHFESLMQAKHISSLPSFTAERHLLIIDQLTASALSEDWGTWLNTLSEIDTQWIKPCLEMLKHGELSSVRCILTGSDSLRITEITSMMRYAFWKKPSISRLLS